MDGKDGLTAAAAAAIFFEQKISANKHNLNAPGTGFVDKKIGRQLTFLFGQSNLALILFREVS